MLKRWSGNIDISTSNIRDIQFSRTNTGYNSMLDSTEVFLVGCKRASHTLESGASGVSNIPRGSKYGDQLRYQIR